MSPFSAWCSTTQTLARALGFEPLWSDAVNDFLQPVRLPLFFTGSGILAAGALLRSWPALLAGFAGTPLWSAIIVPLLVAAFIACSLLLYIAANRLGLPWLYRAPGLPRSVAPVPSRPGQTP